MARSTVHYADSKTNNALKKLHNKLRPAGTPVQRVEYIIELLLLRIFETKIKQDEEFKPLRKLFTQNFKWKNPKTGKEESNENRLFSYLSTVSNDQILAELNDNFFPFYSNILNAAKLVFKGNLPQKVQDQLVLIEEVFGNSNFTNNVNSGNIGEVISIVANDIEEARLLKTDLLGDAIESALSETGGTKDIGLFRTPDHIRQFMTALVEPTFDDVVFDPACGTGGFLFDAFEFVMRRVDGERAWPGPKAHSELREWFDNYFKFNQLDFPTIEQSSQFYRNGVTGIEYLGMIRKMAAINFYVRGLNPANIEQGDSLAKYKHVTDHESKSVILANPPFGAERDQEAYPDVWQEYSKESETTILFLKLMFEQLKPGGRCAVVVSEGFHTWDQFSSKALRKMLLEEAQLRAIISLPQGLFISKTGQGPKTSILVFEKGGKTDWTWFYKVTNDGYTMGTNRREQKGNQLVECLNLYHEFVKHGKQPPETKNQFCIPAEWIKTLDPRVKEKIRTETRADMEIKGKADRKKKEVDLDKKIKAKKAKKADKQMELTLYDQMLENRIQNEIAKRIDKAFNYSFNLANYKSTMSASQITEWTEAFKHVQPNGVTTLDDIYRKLTNRKVENILPYLVKLNPTNALAADIAREYLNNIDQKIIKQHKELDIVKGILESGVKYPFEKLEGKIIPKYVKIKKDDYDGSTDLVDKISFSDGKIHIRNERETGMDLYQAEKGDLITSKINVHQGALALTDRKLLCSTHYQVYEVNKTQIIDEYLVIILRSNQLKKRISEIKNNGIKNEQGAEFLLSLEVPLPSLEQQAAITSQIKKQHSVIDGVNKIVDNWEIPSDFFNDSDGKTGYVMSEVCKFTGGSQPPKEEFIHEPREGYVRLVQIRDFKSENHKTFVAENSVTKFFTEDDIMIARYGPPVFQILRGLSGAYNVALMKAIPNENLVLKDYWFYYLQNPVIQNYVIESSQRTAGQSGVNIDRLNSFLVFLPSKSEQQKIVDYLDSQVAIINSLANLKNDASKRISAILADLWGFESELSNNMEAIDE